MCHQCDQIEPSVFNIEHLASNDQAGRPKRPTLKVNVDGRYITPVTLVTGHPCHMWQRQGGQCYQPFPPSFLFFEPKIFQKEVYQTYVSFM